MVLSVKVVVISHLPRVVLDPRLSFNVTSHLSASVGQNSVESLLGHIGDNDVTDVADAITQCLQAHPELDHRKV